MNQYLIAFCYLFTIVLLFLALFIIRAVPAGSPLNIDLYCDNAIISLAIYNPAEHGYRSNTTKEKIEYPVEDDWNNNWDDHESEDNNAWNHADDWTPGLCNQPQIREITGHLFAQNFRSNYEAEHRIPFCVVTPEPSIPELEEEPVKEAQGQWEIGSNDEIAGFGNFE
jgi:hypothetical protein